MIMAMVMTTAIIKRDRDEEGHSKSKTDSSLCERIACGGQTLLGILLTNNLLSALQGLRCWHFLNVK